MKGWIGVDLDGTIAEYHGWVNEITIGKPIPKMVQRVRQWLSEGLEVRIFTARASDFAAKPQAKLAIEAWCLKHIGRILAVTNIKDYGMVALWDDRAVQVLQNTGMSLGEHTQAAEASNARPHR